MEEIKKYFTYKNIEILDFKSEENGIYKNIYVKIKIDDLKKFNKKMVDELYFITGKTFTIEKLGNDIIKLTCVELLKVNNTNNNDLKLYIGNNPENIKQYYNIIKNNHVLIAGSTGSGKSVFLNNFISDLILLYGRSVNIGYIDLKKVELSRYKDIYNTLFFADNYDDTIKYLNLIINIMITRYTLFEQNKVVDIKQFNNTFTNNLPYIIIVIDELAELILINKKEVSALLQRLLQLGRAAGIIIIAATQRPSADVVSGVLKVNFNTRICFKVGNKHDSITILNKAGAEKLAGNGDGLLLENGAFELVRFQGKAPTKANLQPLEMVHEYIKEPKPKRSIKDDLLAIITSWIITHKLVKKWLNRKKRK